MRAIHISNERKRDAEVAFDAIIKGKTVRTVLPDGTEKDNVKILKTTVSLSGDELARQYGGDLTGLAEALLDEDPDVDMEILGRKLFRTHKLWIDEDNNIAYRINLFQVVRNPDGTERERFDLNRVPGNVNVEIPLKWTGRMFPKAEAIRKFVFTRKYQIRHINGATFDFLYNMAKELDEKKQMVLIGAGKKGNEPILLSRGGEPYRGFLEGRVEGERYALILHLTDIELKGLE